MKRPPLPDNKLAPPPRQIVARARRFITDRGLFSPGERVLVAVSGGADSTCLLLVLAALRRSLGIDLVVAHFDHGLRGTQTAERERRFVASLADQLELPMRCGRGDVRAHAKAHKLSIEEAARELRYRFLARTARAARCEAVATGHTRDDQAETVLLRLVRGSGLRGLAGMAASATWPVASRGETPRLVRPLLGLSRADTERCCGEAGLTPIDDASNRSNAHLRNRVRGELLPLLRRYNPRIEEALVRLAESASGDVELLEQLASEAIESPRAGAARIRLRLLAALPPALQRHAVRLAYARSAGDARGLGERHVAAVIQAAATTGTQLDLPRCVRAAVTRDAVVLRRSAGVPPLPSRPVALEVPGSVDVGGWRIEASTTVRRPRNLSSSDGLVAWIDASALDGALTVRRRRPGDRFQPLGMARAKKLQDFLVDAGVPRGERDALPLVCAGRRIVWVAGQRPAEWAKVTPASRRLVSLRATRARS